MPPLNNPYKLKSPPSEADIERVARRHVRYLNMSGIDTLFMSERPAERDRAAAAIHQHPNCGPAFDITSLVGEDPEGPDKWLAEADKELERLTGKGDAMTMEECVFSHVAVWDPSWLIVAVELVTSSQTRAPLAHRRVRNAGPRPVQSQIRVRRLPEGASGSASPSNSIVSNKLPTLARGALKLSGPFNAATGIFCTSSASSSPPSRGPARLLLARARRPSPTRRSAARQFPERFLSTRRLWTTPSAPPRCCSGSGSEAWKSSPLRTWVASGSSTPSPRAVRGLNTMSSSRTSED